MRRVFPFAVEIDGIGEVIGQFGADAGDVDEIYLPDGEVVEVCARRVSHKDPLVRMIGERCYQHILKRCDDEIDQTRPVIDWKGYAPAPL